MESIKTDRTLEVIKKNTMTVQLKFKNLIPKEGKQSAIIRLIYELDKLRYASDYQLDKLTKPNEKNGFYLKIKTT